MESWPRQACLSQYRFDVKRYEIAGIRTATSTEALLKIAAHHGDGNAHDLVRSFAAHHPCDRIQMTAIQALAAAEPTSDDRLARLADGAASANSFVAAMSAREHATPELQRPRIEGRTD